MKKQFIYLVFGVLFNLVSLNSFAQTEVITISTNRIQCLDKNCNGICDNGDPIITDALVYSQNSCMASCTDANNDGKCDNEVKRVINIQPTPTSINVGTIDPVCDGCNVPMESKRVTGNQLPKVGNTISPKRNILFQ